VNHLCELSAEYRAACNSGNAPEERNLEKRIRQLESWVIVLLSHQSRENEPVVLNYARAILPAWEGTWEEFKRKVDRYEERIRHKPKGRPVDYRLKVTVAWERKLAQPTQTWKAIAEELNLPLESLRRQIRLLRTLLGREKIPLPSGPGQQSKRHPPE
jgi:hypothetical protein